MDSQYVIFTAASTSNIPIAPNQNLQTILQNIDIAINAHNTAPNFSTYNLGPYFSYTVTQTDGTIHPTNNQNFAEGISKILGKTQSDLYTFTGTTYVSDKSVFTTAITNLQAPAYTYAPFSITSADSIGTVWSKTFTGLTGITSSIAPTSANWSTFSISSPTTIVGAFNAVIAHDSTQDTSIATKEPSIGTFNNSANCLAGTSTDSPRATITALTTAICAAPTLNTGSVTWLGVSAGTNLQTSVQNLVNSVSGVLHGYVNAAGTGLSITSASGYGGQTLSADTTWSGYHKVSVDSADTTPGYLGAKLTAGTGISFTVTSPSGNETIQITNTAVDNFTVKANASDANPSTLDNKIGTAGGSWGMSLSKYPSLDNSQLILSPSLSAPDVFIQSLFEYISSDPVALQMFANLIAQAGLTPGTSITDLIVTLTSGTFVLTWTHQAGISQSAKWRQRGLPVWVSSQFSPASPLGPTAATTTGSQVVLNTPLQFQIDTIYSNGTIGSNIYEAINYSCQTLSSAVTSGVISINQLVLPLIDIIQYQLIYSGTTIQTINTTGNIPNISFASVASGSYTVKWRMGTQINGSVLYSDDASQLNALCVSGTITVP